MNKKEKTLRTTLIILFIMFMTIYISQAAGYYDYKLHKRTVLTEEQIKKFEEDVKNNKKIDIEEYASYGIVDYNNNFSNAGKSFSNTTSKYFRKGIEGLINIIKTLFT